MPRGILTKVDMLGKVLKLKSSVSNRDGIPKSWTNEQIDSANYVLNKVLDVIEEYYQ